MQGMKKSCVSIGLLFCHNSGANELFSPKVSQKICSSFLVFFLLQCFGSCLSWFWSKCFSFLVGLLLHLGLLVHQILHFLGLLLHLGLLVHHFCFSRIICAPWIVGLLVHVMAACCCFFCQRQGSLLSVEKKTRVYKQKKQEH